MSDEKSDEIFSLSQERLAGLEKDLGSLLGTFSVDERKINELKNLLISKYSESHRAYHNLSHIENLLSDAEAFKVVFSDYESVRLTIWFHDAIYEPKSQTNEIESAHLAVEYLTELKFPKKKIEKVEKMILATQKHDATDLDEAGKLFLDLDLGILGAKPENYKKYSQAIRQEYSFVPEDLYCRKRREVLESFLQREFIYYTGEMRTACEKAARFNIANEIKELS